MAGAGGENSLSCGADRPVVIPRGRRPQESSSIPLERWILPLIAGRKPVLICVTAPPGGGKTTALRYLSDVLPAAANVKCFDAHQIYNALRAAQSEIVILFAEAVPLQAKLAAYFELSPWTLDDCLEYLLARHREQVSSVLRRLTTDPSLATLDGKPGLLIPVLDQLTADASLATAHSALQKVIAALPVPSGGRDRMISFVCRQLKIERAIKKYPAFTPEELTSEPLPWVRHSAVQRIYLAQAVVEMLSEGKFHPCLKGMQSAEIIPEIALAAATVPQAVERLNELVTNRPLDRAVPMAASILLRVSPDWRPVTDRPLNLKGAILRAARWAEIDLQYSILSDADFTGADLQRAHLEMLHAPGVRFARANLSGANLNRGKFQQAIFAGANLSDAIAENANFTEADFTGADLRAANLFNAQFSHAMLKQASLQNAQFRSSILNRTEVEDSDFSNADFAGAKLSNVDMQNAVWNHASFEAAQLISCNLEGVEITGANFSQADLTGSLLTASRMPHANFESACLTATGLAEIDWEYANLRCANLSRASFHLGSSRSGLVGSTIPCEGSRTGFYTDEYNEQDFKSPEEIRKACLVGAQLRGALLTGTDFYLVDLREADYTESQYEHFARCGAILVSRVV